MAMPSTATAPSPSTRIRAWWSGYAKTFSDKLRGTLALGMNQGKTAQAVDNKRLLQWFFNLIYSPIKNVELGGELILGERQTFGGEKGAMQRVDLMGRYLFVPRPMSPQFRSDDVRNHQQS